MDYLAINFENVYKTEIIRSGPGREFVRRYRKYVNQETGKTDRIVTNEVFNGIIKNNYTELSTMETVATCPCCKGEGGRPLLKHIEREKDSVVLPCARRFDQYIRYRVCKRCLSCWETIEDFSVLVKVRSNQMSIDLEKKPEVSSSLNQAV